MSKREAQTRPREWVPEVLHCFRSFWLFQKTGIQLGHNLKKGQAANYNFLPSARRLITYSFGKPDQVNDFRELLIRIQKKHTEHLSKRLTNQEMHGKILFVICFMVKRKGNRNRIATYFGEDLKNV